MSTSYSISESTSFTVTHARHMAAKVATDLKRMQRLYGSPSDLNIANYETEIVALLKAGYLNTVCYGYRRDEQWVEPTLRYTAKDLAGAAANDDDPGRVRPGADITGASFYSFLTYTSAWFQLPADLREIFENNLPFQRHNAAEPSVNGYFSSDRTYSAGGQALNRDSVRSW